MFKLVAMGIAGGGMVAAFMVAALQNPYLYPRSEKLAGRGGTHNAFMSAPSAHFSPTPELPSLPLSRVVEAGVPVSRPPAPSGFSAYAGTIPTPEREAVPLIPSFPAAPPVSIEEKGQQPGSAPMTMQEVPQVWMQKGEAPPPPPIIAPPPPTGLIIPHKPVSLRGKISRRSTQEKPIRIIRFRQDDRLDNATPSARSDMLTAQSISRIRPLYGFRSSAQVTDGPAIIRLR